MWTRDGNGRWRTPLVAAVVLALLAGFVPAVARREGRRQVQASEELERQLAALRQALDRYRDDRGWYPGDPDRDYNSDGRPEILVRQLTWFTRDDGKPSDRRDADYCFGPYLHDFPMDPLSGSRAVALDQDRARALSRLRDDVAAGGGRGGWYYEARTGNIVANYGRGSRALYARF